jgi:hypothetical protein
MTTGGLVIGATGTLGFNSGSGTSTIKTTLGPEFGGFGTFLYGGLALDLSTLTSNGDIVLVENQNAGGFVSGTFTDLAEGTTFRDASLSKIVTITYVGIAGVDAVANDIMLTSILDTADFDEDGDVDGDDFIIWQQQFVTVHDIKPYIPVLNLNLNLNLTPRPRIVPGDFRAAGDYGSLKSMEQLEFCSLREQHGRLAA